MNTKSLFLGSAAALFAVSGAYAADAVVVAEPEPMEYVRVCDVYGAGFYYIPGTETCLRVGGYLRYDIGVGDRTGYGGFTDVVDKGDAFDGVDSLNDTYYKRARVALQLDARSETELGTLRAYMHLNFNWDGGDVNDDGITTTSTEVAIEHAYIELGGFRIGKSDSLFSTFTGYAGGVIADDIIPYGPFDTHQIVYTYTGGNGFSAAIGLEEGDGPLFTLDSYVPHVVGGLSFTQGWGGVSAVVGYDSVWEEWAGKVRLDVNATETVSLFIMGGWQSDADRPNFYGSWNGDWAVWGGGTAKLSEKATLNVQLSYTETEDFAAVAGLAYELVPNLTITPEVNYVDNFDVDGEDGVGGFLRFQRNF
ncbi:porin [Pseudaminobacter arsenicus]|uniref:Porin n=1 Tax=Borborobacter arsenicus TaxID=1851146 RepID=A0A432V2Q3_9HYPH|nr:porin [Pseudaminobacter arsenicus]RUM96380.1 porin [Pseudaminobacter arsenicus]